jgi:hypothetical protein
MSDRAYTAIVVLPLYLLAAEGLVISYAAVRSLMVPEPLALSIQPPLEEEREAYRTQIGQLLQELAFCGQHPARWQAGEGRWW